MRVSVRAYTMRAGETANWLTNDGCTPKGSIFMSRLTAVEISVPVDERKISALSQRISKFPR